MAQQKALERMNGLIRSLQEAMGHLGEGKLGLEGLERCTQEAQALYERLVVLRHKAREAEVATGKKQTPALPEAPEKVAEPAPTPTPTIRLDTRPPEPPPQQTSLIDAIAETETAPVAKPTATPVAKASEPVKAEAPKTPKARAISETPEPPAEPPKPPKASPAAPPVKKERPASMADKMEHAPVADLRKAIALSQKFWFVAELFGGERDRYEKAINAINGMAAQADAEAYVRDEITAKLPTPPGEEVANTFMELIQRRFR